MAGNEQDPLEHVFLNASPNPDRIGCPTQEVLQSIARRELPLNHEAFSHVGNCSECFRDIKAYQSRFQKRARRRVRVLLGAAAAACALLVIGAWLSGIFPGHRTAATAIVAASRTIDLYDWDALRGSGTVGEGRELALPRSMVRVRVILPRFSRPGTYQIAVCRERSLDSTIAENTAAATSEGPREIVSVVLDLRAARAGSFWLATRRDQDEAGYYFPVRIS
jgi:hypothetical protein